jgi:hypothetical protein
MLVLSFRALTIIYDCIQRVDCERCMKSKERRYGYVLVRREKSDSVIVDFVNLSLW